ncbi:MAG: hypothetical protein M0Z61_00630 [Nitrospiraceae bacterium]|nr:hypothetical protein [Nitrospiraceae bacterium]
MKFYFDTLRSLYIATETPVESQGKFYDYPEAEDVIDAVRVDQSLYPLSITDEAIRESIVFFLRLVNTPNGLKGASKIEKSVRYLVDAAIQRIDAKDTIRKILNALQDSWYKALKHSPLFDSKFSKRTLVEDSPLFYFHLVSAGLGDKIPPSKLYLAYGYLAHKSLRNIFVQEAADSSKDSYALSARYFFTHVNPVVDTKSNYPPEITKKFLDLFRRQFDIDKYGDADKKSDIAESHRSRLERLFKHATLRPRAPRGDDNEEQTEERKRDDKNAGSVSVDSTPIIANGNKHSDGLKLRVYQCHHSPQDETEARCQEFEAPDEMEVVEQQNDKKIVNTRPTLKRSFTDLVNLRSFIIPWDSAYLNMFDFAILYQRANELWGTSPLNNAIISYIDVLAHTGMAPRTLLDLCLENSTINEGILVLKERGGILYILVDSVVQHKKEFSHPNCRKISSKIWVPLPSGTSEKITSLYIKDCNRIFSYRESGHVKRMTLLDVKSYLDNLNKTWGSHLTVENISKSFLPMFHGRFGLDPLVCVLIAGQDHFRLFSTLLHYVHISHDRVQKEYIITAQKMNAEVKKNLAACVRLGFMTGCASKTPTTEGKNSNTDEISVAPYRPGEDEFFDFGYGSKIICDTSYMAAVIKAIRNAINDASNPLFRHNLLTLYLYVFLQFCTCLRPRNNPQILWSDLTLLETLTISDKQSAQYHEERSIYLPEILGEVLRLFRSEVMRVRTYLASNYSTDAIMRKKDMVFFFVDEETGIPIDFTLKKMEEYLSAIICMEWTLPPNFARHYTCHYLYEHGVPLDAIEFWMGHQHAGREIHNITSSTGSLLLGRLILPHIRALLFELGFTQKIFT